MFTKTFNYEYNLKKNVDYFNFTPCFYNKHIVLYAATSAINIIIYKTQLNRCFVIIILK